MRALYCFLVVALVGGVAFGGPPQAPTPPTPGQAPCVCGTRCVCGPADTCGCGFDNADRAYRAAVKLAEAANRPLVVFVGRSAADVPGCTTCSSPPLAFADGTRWNKGDVIVSWKRSTGWIGKAAAGPTANDVRDVLAQYKVPMPYQLVGTAPASGCQWVNGKWVCPLAR